MQRGLVIVAVLLALGTLYTITYAETRYLVAAVYVAGNSSAKHLDLVKIIECNNSLKAAIYSSNNHTKVPSLVIIYAPSGAEPSRASIAQCLRSIIRERHGTLYLPLSFTMAARAKTSPRKTLEKESIITSISNVTQCLSSQVTKTTTRLVAKTTTTIAQTTTAPTTTKRTTTAQEALYSSASVSTPTATPVSMPSTEHTVRGAGLSPGERLGLVLGSAIAAAVLVYVAWRIKIG